MTDDDAPDRPGIGSLVTAGRQTRTELRQISRKATLGRTCVQKERGMPRLKRADEHALRPPDPASMCRVLVAAPRRATPVSIFSALAEEARARAAQGFKLVTPSNDFAHLTRSIRSAVITVLEGSEPMVMARPIAKYGY